MKIIKQVFILLMFLSPLGSFASTTCHTVFKYACLGPPCPAGVCRLYTDVIVESKPSSDIFQNQFDSGLEVIKSEQIQSFKDILTQFKKSSTLLADAYQAKLNDIKENTSKILFKVNDTSGVANKEYVDKKLSEDYQQEKNMSVSDSPFNINIGPPKDDKTSTSQSDTPNNQEQQLSKKATITDTKNLQAQCNLIKTKNAFYASNNKQLSKKSSSYFLNSSKISTNKRLFKESIVFGNRESELYGMNISSKSITTNHKGKKSLISVLPFIENVATNRTKSDDLSRLDPVMVNNVLSYLSKLSVSRDTLLKIADENNSTKDMFSKIELLKKQTKANPIKLNKKSSGFQNLYFSYLTDYTLSIEELSKYENLELILSSVLSQSIKKRN